MEDLLITADWLVPVSSPPIEKGGVRVRDGRIAAVGPAVDVAVGACGARCLDLGRAALLPGLVNVHGHLELTALRGYLEGPDFFAWIRKLTDAKYERLDGEELLASARWGVAEATRAGGTTIGEVCDLGVSVRALTEGGLRAVAYQEVFGPDPARATSSLAGLEAKLEAHGEAAGPRVRLGVSPHAPYTVSSKLLRLVADLAIERGLPTTIHAGESAAEGDFVRRGEGPFADFLRRRGIEVEGTGSSTIGLLDKLGVLRCRPLLVHCVDCDGDDLEKIASAGATIAHCPKSNAKLGHGIAPWREMRDRGIGIGVGSDGVICNNAMDLFEELRCAALLDRARGVPAGAVPAPGARELLRAVTIDGACVLGFGEETGTIDAGKAADLCAVDLSGPHIGPVHDIETAVVWSASAADVSMTMVGGDVLWLDGRWTRWDLDGLRADVGRVPGVLRDRDS